jgi:SAM-dependent methyltransferase
VSGGGPAADGRFRSAASWYARYRPGYPPALLDRVVRACALDGSGRLLDLGCGPGVLAIALRPHVAAAVGIDPAPEMLAEARAAAVAAGVDLTLIEASARDLGPQLGRFRIVTMGRSFHWMDREATLRALDPLVETGGSIVLLHAGDGGSAWQAAYHEVARHWVAPAAWAENRRRHGPEWERNDAVLARSAFSRITRLTEPVVRRTAIDDLVGRAFSMSLTTPEALGAGQAGFVQALRARLAAIAPGGLLEECTTAEALIAQRP